MRDESLQPATDDEVAWSVSVVLRGIDRQTRGRRPRAGTLEEDEAMAVAKRIVEHLQLSRFRVMKLPPREPH